MPKKKRRISREPIVRRIAMILESGTPTRFAFEGACRHGLRSHMCLRGASWRDADDFAAEIVRLALVRIGAVRPSWKDGQPEVRETLLTERSRCVTCHGVIEDAARTKFCSVECMRFKNARIEYVKHEHEAEAQRLARAAANGAWPARTCAGCGEEFRVERIRIPAPKFCSIDCFKASRPRRFKECPACGKQFHLRDLARKYCSKACSDQALVRAAPATCKQCGTEFVTKPSRAAQYCSRACFNDSRKG